MCVDTYNSYGKDRNNIPYWNIIFTNLIHYFIQQESSTLQKVVHSSRI
jgi:hypothetical protein